MKGFFKNCKRCEKQFYVFPSRKKSKYCSVSCARKDRILTKKTKEKISQTMLGRKIEWKDKISNSLKGNKNPNWKGDKVGLEALHNWVKRRIIKPEFCECCKTNKPYDLANISQKYKRDISDWEWLCRKCHMKKDGRLDSFSNLNE